MGNVIAALCDKITFQKVQPDISPVLSFPGLEIKQHQRRVLRDGNEVPLTRNEYGVLAYLAAYPGHVFSKEQIFEEVWSMESESCFYVVANTICRLRAKIEPDREHPTYIKTVYNGYCKHYNMHQTEYLVFPLLLLKSIRDNPMV